MQQYQKPPFCRIADADANGAFASGLEYNPPVRGMWNIVHMGMLVPEAHQIYACAQGCLRGVILTAAEMHALDRLSWISLTEEDMFNGTLESSLVEGVSEIIEKLGFHPPMIPLFLSCMHLFAGCDFDSVLTDLSERYPDITFVDCYMTPTMRLTISPVAQCSRQLYMGLKPLPQNPKAVNLIGCDRLTDENAELLCILRNAGMTVHDLPLCRTYDEYLQMAESRLNIAYLPTAHAALDALEQKLGIPQLFLPARFDFDGLCDNYRLLCDALGLACPDFTAEIAAADAALRAAQAEIGETAVAIDYTAVSRPFELAKLLCEYGFNVQYIVADAAGEDAEAFAWLQENCPGILLYSPTNVNMLHQHENAPAQVLAVGQKAAYYFATDRFVNFVVNGGYYGFAGIRAIAALMQDAFRNPKDRRPLLRHKGYGCDSCLLS